MRVLAALSGGVDSAVAAARVLDGGHDVVGVHMALTRNRAATRSGSRGCCSIEDASDARWAAEILGIPFYVWDLSEQFEERVVADFLAEYRAGRTPNPCVRCNERVDAAKDQSYVLAISGREGLSRALFPLGDAPSKAAVRAEAERRGLPVAAKPDSYDICFIADGDTRGFLTRSLGTSKGALVSPDGEILGTHSGYFGFTVGQRRGLGLTRPAPDGHPRYVIETRPATNEVVVGPAELLHRSAVDGQELVLLAEPNPLGEGAVGWRDVTVQVRAHGRSVPADVAVDPVARTLRADLRQPLRGLAAGQSIVIYGTADAGSGGERALAQATVSQSR